MTDSAAPQITKLSKESGFVILDLFRPPYSHKLPLATPGLLAFLQTNDDREKVLRLLLVNDLAKGFAQSRPFCGKANRVAYLPFQACAGSDIEQYRKELNKRFALYAQLTERYKVPQTVWPLDEHATIPPI